MNDTPNTDQTTGHDGHHAHEIPVAAVEAFKDGWLATAAATNADRDANIAGGLAAAAPLLVAVERERIAQAIEARAADDDYLWASGRHALNHAAGIARSAS
jgi:hypothetical protein